MIIYRHKTDKGMVQSFPIPVDLEKWDILTVDRLEDAHLPLQPEVYNIEQEQNRKQAYQTESDSLFFDYQKGEIDKQVWLDKIQEIKDRFPYK